MFAPGTCQIVVTYRDTNCMWKDRAVNQTDMTETIVSPTETAIRCFSPDFWARFAQPSRIERVMVTQQGHTFRLPWRAEMNLATPSALSMDFHLHHNGHEMLTGVTWK
jgi:hypothetical protein